MKLRLTKKSFLESWSIAERCAGANGVNNIFSTVFIEGDADGVTTMKATDIRTSIIVKAQDVEVIEPGAAVLPVKRVSELFNKAGADEMTLHVADGQAVLLAGKSRCKFMTYPPDDFPKLPASGGAEFLFGMKSDELARALECGFLCATSKETFPQYLSSGFLDVSRDGLSVASTDKRCLAVYYADTDSQSGEGSILLPMKGIRELLRILTSPKEAFDVRVSIDDAQAYFVSQDITFSVRRIDVNFPDYKSKLPISFHGNAKLDKAELLSALERVNVVVKDYNKTVKVTFAEEECQLLGRSAEFGEARESLKCLLDGEAMTTYFNVDFLMDGVKSCEGPSVTLSYQDPLGHLMVHSASSDKFKYLAAPMDAPKEDPADVEEEISVL